MSSPFNPNRLLQVRRLNLKLSGTVGWAGHIPASLIEAFPGLGADPGSVALAEAVFAYQATQEHLAVDGVLGAVTWAEMQVDAEEDTGERPIRWGKEFGKAWSGTAELRNFYNPKGLSLMTDGGWSKTTQVKSRPRDTRLIVIHWGGLDAKHCRQALANQDLSSHFGVDRGVVYNWLDLQYVGWHAGRNWNSQSVGIDICQHPQTSMLSHYQAQTDPLFKAIHPIANPTRVGDRKVLSLCPETAAAVRDLVFWLCDNLDIPPVCPRNADGTVSHVAGVDKSFTGVVGHHHLAATKWDMACWWESIFAGTELGDPRA